MVNSNVVLETQKINKSFPGVHALSDVDFNLCSGEIHGLVGHNGAGKSTFVKVLTGAHTPESGGIFIDGQEVSFRHPKDAIAKGVGIVTQEGTLVDTFSGVQNIFLGKEICSFGRVVNEKALAQKGQELLKHLNVDIDLNAPVSELSPAKRKLIEIMKIINQNPRIVIFDESTASLSDKERRQLFDVMFRFRDAGLGVIFISHYIDEVIEICDRITVMRDGAVVGTVNASDVTKHDIVRMMINKEQKSEFIEYERTFGDPLLVVEGLSDGKVVEDASLYIRKGEVVGLFGAVGSGRTELAETLFGARARKSGTVTMEGEVIAPKNTQQAISMGIGLIPEDRLNKALMLEDTIVDNITLPFLRHYTKATVVLRSSELKDAQETAKILDIKAPSILTKVNSLSGGNKQKVSFGKWIATTKQKIKLYIFDEPTEGVDVGACAEMYKIIASLVQKQEAGCLVISSDLSEVIGLSDRIYVMQEGKIVAEFKRGEDNLQQKLIASSLGMNEGEIENA